MGNHNDDLVAELREALQRAHAAHKDFLDAESTARELRTAWRERVKLVEEIQGEILTGSTGRPILDRINGNGTAPAVTAADAVAEADRRGVGLHDVAMADGKAAAHPMDEHQALDRALRMPEVSGSLDTLARHGATDLEILATLERWPLHRVLPGIGPGQPWGTAADASGPRFYSGHSAIHFWPHGVPLMQGAKLVAAVRKALKIPKPKPAGPRDPDLRTRTVQDEPARSAAAVDLLELTEGDIRKAIDQIEGKGGDGSRTKICLACGAPRKAHADVCRYPSGLNGEECRCRINRTALGVLQELAAGRPVRIDMGLSGGSPAAPPPADVELPDGRAVAAELPTASGSAASLPVLRGKAAHDKARAEFDAAREVTPAMFELDRLLIHACRDYDPSMREFWSKAAESGADDDMIRFFLDARWPKSRVFVGADRTKQKHGYTIQSARGVRIWVGPFLDQTPNLSGGDLIDRIRVVMGIPQPGSLATTSAPAPSLAKPARKGKKAEPAGVAP